MLYHGWSRREIEFDKPVCLMGQRQARISTHVADPLTVTALALKSENDQAVIVSADLAMVVKWMMDRIRADVAARTEGLDPNKIILSTTHTHTGPTFEEYWYGPQPPHVTSCEESFERFRRAAVDAICAAWNNMREARVSRAFEHAVVGHNRRATYFDGSAKMYGKTNVPEFDCVEGYEDHSVDLLFFWDGAQRLTGMIVNVPCPAQVTEGADYVSADFWHEARTEIRKRLGKDVHVLPQCGAAGDQSPHFILYDREEAYMRQLRGVTEREEIGRRIANAVEDAATLARKDIRQNVCLHHVAEVLELPRRKITEKEYESAKAVCAEMEKFLAENPNARTSARFELFRARQVVERYERPESIGPCPTEVHAVRIGDVVMTTNPFELFLDYGLRIKAQSPASQTFVTQLACDWQGYLPTAKAIRGGHYSADALDGQLGPEGGQMLVERTLEMINTVWNDTRD